MVRNYVVLVRGPSGSGKTSLCKYWTHREPYNFELLSTDAIQDRVGLLGLSDEAEFDLVLHRVGSEVALQLSAAALIIDAGLRDAEHVDRVLEMSERRRGDRDVILVRLTVSVEEAIDRKRDLPEARVRELHSKWQTRPVPGEFVLDTSGIPAAEVARRFGLFLTETIPVGDAGVP